MKRVMGLIVACVFMVCLSHASAAPALKEASNLLVSEEPGYNLLLETPSVRYFQGLSGRGYAEVWFEYRYTDKPAAPEAVLHWFGVDTPVSVQRVRQHFLFFFPAPSEEQRALRMELNAELYDAKGTRIFRMQGESSPGSKWYSLDRVEQKIMQALLEDPQLQDRKRIDPRIIAALPYKRANEGFLGLRWGNKPAQVKQISYLSSPNDQIDIYQTTVYNARSILGEAGYAAGARLVFDKAEGLVQGHIAVSTEDVNKVEQYLFDKLGHPVIMEISPLLFEKTGPFWLWNLGDDARVVLYTGNLQHRPRVEISKPGFGGASGSE